MKSEQKDSTEKRTETLEAFTLSCNEKHSLIRMERLAQDTHRIASTFVQLRSMLITLIGLYCRPKYSVMQDLR